MHSTIEALVNGDRSVVQHYARAKQLWDEILASPDAANVDALSQRLSSAQFRFENECGGRWVGQEIMVIVGIAQFYSTVAGFDGNVKRARLVYDALRASHCSMEVKGHAERVAESYSLLERSE